MEFDKQESEMTTLSVPKKFRQHLKKEYCGSNDFERLEKWASEFSEEQAEHAVASYLKSEVFEDEVIGVIKKELTTYNTELRDDLEELIQETVRDMQGSRY